MIGNIVLHHDINLQTSPQTATDAQFLFLSCVSIMMRNIDISILSVCQSVRCIPVLYQNGSTYCHSFFTTQQPNHSTIFNQ